MIPNNIFFYHFCLQGHCQAYEYGSNGCIPQGNLPWDEYNHYSAYASGHRVMVHIPIVSYLFTIFSLHNE